MGDELKTVKFRYDNGYSGYRCSEPGDMDGEYVPAAVARGLLAAERAKVAKLIAAWPTTVEVAPLIDIRDDGTFWLEDEEGYPWIACHDGPYATRAEAVLAAIGERDEKGDRDS